MFLFNLRAALWWILDCTSSSSFTETEIPIGLNLDETLVSSPGLRLLDSWNE